MSLLSKMMRIAGRDPAGNAKAIQTDADGNLKTHAKQEEVEIVSSGALAAGATSAAIKVYAKGSNFILLSLQIDKQPWSITTHARFPWARENYQVIQEGGRNFFPDIVPRFTAICLHGTCVFMPIIYWLNIAAPQSLQEALKVRYLPDVLPGNNALELYIKNNHSTDAANYELMIFRSWRAF